MSTTVDTGSKAGSAMTAGRVLGFLVASFATFGLVYFGLLDPDGGIGQDPWYDVVMSLFKLGIILALFAVALARMEVRQRVKLAVIAVVGDYVFHLYKVVVADELGPSLAFAVVDALVLLLVWLGGRRRA